MTGRISVRQGPLKVNDTATVKKFKACNSSYLSLVTGSKITASKPLHPALNIGVRVGFIDIPPLPATSSVVHLDRLEAVSPTHIGVGALKSGGLFEVVHAKGNVLVGGIDLLGSPLGGFLLLRLLLHRFGFPVHKQVDDQFPGFVPL